MKLGSGQQEMKVSLDWLREYDDWKGSVEELDDLLTRTGIKVESITTNGANFPNVVIAQIVETSRHPNADRLSVCRRWPTERARRVASFAGQKTSKRGDKVPLALPGAVLPGGMKIKVGKLRGVESEGMLCSAKELGLSDDAGRPS